MSLNLSKDGLKQKFHRSVPAPNRSKIMESFRLRGITGSQVVQLRTGCSDLVLSGVWPLHKQRSTNLCDLAAGFHCPHWGCFPWYMPGISLVAACVYYLCTHWNCRTFQDCLGVSGILQKKTQQKKPKPKNIKTNETNKNPWIFQYNILLCTLFLSWSVIFLETIYPEWL